ncbi:hypothetical protein A2U01_0109614, partial [Trifolium medium]|nr:hypothetical protein [Trifolium medium]
MAQGGDADIVFREGRDGILQREKYDDLVQQEILST